MKQLTFERNHKTHWQECKRELRTCFWNDLHGQMLQGAKQVIQGLIDSEFNECIGAQPYERTQKRLSKRNGCYLRNLETRYGRIEEIKIPRARSLDIRFSIFDKWQQVEEGVLESMLKAYLLGRSGRCAQEIIKSFHHSSFSRSFLSRLVHRFEKNLQKWHTRPIEKAWPYLFVDGMCVNVREADYQRWSVLWALGMDEERHTEVLGFLVVKSESQEGTERLLNDLKARGLKSPELIISDDSEAIQNGAAMIFPHTPQQGCVFHKVKATGRHLRKRQNKRGFLREASDVYLKSTGRRMLVNRLKRFQKRWRRREPEATKSFLRGFERTMTYLDFPQEHWTWIRTNNPLERFIGGVRNWTHRFGYFQGRGNLQTALFTYLCHQNPELVPDLNSQKDTIYIA